MAIASDHGFGPALREWRRSRGMSQLTLALAAQTSARHLSFIETGRARPSRAMVLRLAEALDVPMRDRNSLLNAAGFAALYRESPLDADEMAQVRHALQFMLDKQEPYPALVLDRGWNLLMVNGACQRLMELLGVGGAQPEAPPNLLRLMLHPQGVRSHVEDWEATAHALIVRARREAATLAGNEAELALLDEVLGYPGVPADWREPAPQARALPLLPVTFLAAGLRLSWFTTITTFGTPQDITLQELRIETCFPADAATERYAQGLATAAH